MTWVPRRTTLIAVAVALLVAAGAAHAKQTPEQKCQKGRYDAAAKYEACQQKAIGQLYGGGGYEKYIKAVGTCAAKYRAVWPKLQKKASGTGAYCDNPRFADYGSSVGDRLTGLTWERKTDDATIHDKDNFYSWSAGGFGYEAADGSAYTTFLAALNTGCFAGHCDWRLPTIAELQTILLEPHPCGTRPCIDPIFGPTLAGYYWSSTTHASSPDFAWFVYFGDGAVADYDKDGTIYVRAVRGGS